MTCSYSEDRFGVAQRNMTEILTALLQLSLVLDKTGRAPVRASSCFGMSSVGTVAEMAPHHIRLRKGLKTALRTALYRLTATFGSTLKNVKLGQPQAVLAIKLDSFLQLTEG